MQALLNRIRSVAGKIDWQLLIFLVLVMNVKLVVKIAAIVLFGLLRLRALTRKDAYRPRYILFYCVLLLIAWIDLLVFGRQMPEHYFPVFIVGSGTWLLCIAGALILADMVARIRIELLWSTIKVFFLLNIMVSFGQLAWMMIDSGALNPYRFQGNYQEYWINTGDRVTGISFDVCSTNAIVSAMGLFFFLYRDKMVFALLCMVVLLMTTSNFTNILLLCIFVIILFGRTTKSRKSVVIACVAMLAIFLLRISPQNSQYLSESFAKYTGRKPAPARILTTQQIPLTEQPDSTLTLTDRRRKMAMLYMDSINFVRVTGSSQPGIQTVADALPAAKPSLPVEPIHSVPYQRRKDSTEYQRKLVAYAREHFSSSENSDTMIFRTRGPGKLQAFKQLKVFLLHDPLNLLTGTGMGNFSSKLAFRATTLGVAGGYPKKWLYLHPAFLHNHLALYIHYFSMDTGVHSFTNSPNSVYGQLLGEYGIIGLLAFAGLYAFYFWKIKGGYALPLLLVMLGSLWVDYWLEQISILVIFELLMLTRKKELQVAAQ